MNNLHFDTDLLALLPPWYRQILDYQQICQSEQKQFELLAEEITAVADNFFFQSMDLSAISMWEQIFSIMADPSSEDLAFRRFRVLNRVSSRPPFTMGFLRQKLDELIGLGQWTVEMDYPNYTLYIESAAYNQNYATEISYTINHVKPAHIAFINRPYTVGGIALSETISMDKRVYQYRLGSWGLGVAAFAQNNSIGVIKTASTPSIQAALLNGVAGYVAGDIASAQINGGLAIGSLTKETVGSTLTVTYVVTPSDAAEITKAALLDAEGNILTQSDLYVPVTDVTIIKHVIPVTEGEGGTING